MSPLSRLDQCGPMPDTLNPYWSINMNSRLKYLAIPIAVAALLVGCGSDDDSSDTSTTTTEAPATQTEAPAPAESPGDTIALAADPTGALAYDTTSLDAKAGTVSIDFTNESNIPHDVVVEQGDSEVARTSIITESSETVTFDAKPGEYTFYCSVPGHEAAGMVGTLDVKK